MKCPKCRYESGDDWSQCRGSCPMPMSPFFNMPEPFPNRNVWRTLSFAAKLGKRWITIAKRSGRYPPMEA